MALAATIVFEIRTTGNDTNGGGYKSNAGTTDYSQQNAAQLSVADAACTGNTTVTSATGGFTAQMVGNLIYLSSGPNWYEITGFTNGNTITIDRNGPNASGMTANVGGALASVGRLGFILSTQGVAGMQAYLKFGDYDYTTTTINVPGGALVTTTASGSVMANKTFYLKGYDIVRTDYTGNRPAIKANGIVPSGGFLMDLGGNSAGPNSIANIIFDGESGAVNGVRCAAGTCNFFYNCLIKDCDATTAFLTCTCIGCKVESCAAMAFNAIAFYCWCDNCETGYNSIAINCVASNCTDGYIHQLVFAMNCVAYNCSADGFECNNVVRPNPYINCISYDVGSYAYRGSDNTILLNCAHGAATLGRHSGSVPLLDLNPITLTADPFVDAVNGDFSLNNVAGGGALLRAAGFDPYWLDNFQDVGTYQHQDSGGAGGFFGNNVSGGTQEMTERKKGSTDVSLSFRLVDKDTGKAKTGIDVTTLSLSGWRPQTAPFAATPLTLLAFNVDPHTDFGARETDSVKQPGMYRVDAPDSYFATGADEVTLTVTGASIEPCSRLVSLTSFDSRDAIRGGLTALPNIEQGNVGQLALGDNAGRPTVAAFVANAITSAAINNGAFTAAKFAADYFTAIAAAVWNALLATYNLANSFGNRLQTFLDVAVSSRMATFVYTVPPTAAQVATQVRVELGVELARMDANVSSRMATFAYTAPDNAGIAATLNRVNLLPLLVDIFVADWTGIAFPPESFGGYIQSINTNAAILLKFETMIIASGPNWQYTADALELAPAGGGGGGGPIGPGADLVTININVGGVDIPDADVWITADEAGAIPVAGTLQTDSNGNVQFMLDDGNTYFLWMQKNGVNSILGEEFVAVAD